MLYNRACRLWRDIAYLRDGKVCQVKKYFPHIKVAHSPIMQVDHVITARDKNFYFDTNNGVVICSTCNRLKKFHSRGIDYAVYEICSERISASQFRKMMETHQKGVLNKNWRSLIALRETVARLEKEFLVLMEGDECKTKS